MFVMLLPHLFLRLRSLILIILHIRSVVCICNKRYTCVNKKFDSNIVVYMNNMADDNLNMKPSIVLLNGSVNRNQTSYSKEEVMLKVKTEPPAAYRVLLPKGMEYPTLTKKEQIVVDKKKKAQEENPNKTDLDLLKEELQKITAKMAAKD